MPLMSKLQAAYLAGIIDGEGYLGIQKKKRKSGDYYYTPIIKVMMTDKNLIYSFKNNFGGLVWVRKSQNNRRECYGWEYKLTGMPILKYVYPYLKVKKKQADILKKFLSTIDKKSYHIVYRKPGRGGRFKTLRPEIQEYRIELYNILRYLNHRGTEVVVQPERLNEITL